MSTYSGYMNKNRQASFTDSTKSIIPLTPGIYVGVVKLVDTGTRSGLLHVYIDGFGGNDPTNPQNWFKVLYASPFMGSTPGPIGSSDQTNSFDKTKQTYGFTMIPPDIDNLVLCCFPEGKMIEGGYWFACVNHNLSRHMIPSIGSLPKELIEPDSIPAALAQYVKPGNIYPTGEFNEQNPGVFNSGWAGEAKPLHPYQLAHLINQGLQDDPVRGTLTSSAQREGVSGVFGISTPGRPIPAQDSPDYTDPVTTRVGGHSLTMDDGDANKESILTRLRTAAGHQLLMNDSEGILYISNATGNSWVELTKEGDVLIYAKRDLSIRTQGNLMMHSDIDVTINAARNFNVYAGQSVNTESLTVNTTAKDLLNVYAGNGQIATTQNMSLLAGGFIGVEAAGPLILTGKPVDINGGAQVPQVNPPTPLTRYSLFDTISDGNIGWKIETNHIQSAAYKVPTHEPYLRSTQSSAEAQAQAIIRGIDIKGNPISRGLTAKGYGGSKNSNIGPGLAANQPASNLAPTSSFLKQPAPGKGLGALSEDQLQAYMAQVGFNESGGNYGSKNQYNYLGKYQMGAAALADAGYVKPGTTQATVMNPANWTGKDGLNSPQDFLNNPSVQEQQMYNYTANNYAALQRTGVITANTPTDQTAGFLQASHLVGAGAVTTWAQQGISSSDANGTTVASYYNRGVYSQSQVPTIQASNASRVPMTSVALR